MNQSIGVGETVEKNNKATGIKKLVEAITRKKDCGSDKRTENKTDKQTKNPEIIPPQKHARRISTRANISIIIIRKLIIKIDLKIKTYYF